MKTEIWTVHIPEEIHLILIPVAAEIITQYLWEPDERWNHIWMNPRHCQLISGIQRGYW